MKLIDNLNHRFGDDIKQNLHSGSKLKIAASFFSIYAYAALKQELKNIDGMQFLFTSPTFVPNDVTDKLKKEKREFVIPKLDREDSLYGTEFEIHLRNKLTQKAISVLLLNKKPSQFLIKLRLMPCPWRPLHMAPLFSKIQALPVIVTSAAPAAPNSLP